MSAVCGGRRSDGRSSTSCRATDGHVTGSELVERCREVDPATTPSTVYRTLDVLEELGLVRHGHGADGREEFHVLPEVEHGHLHCAGCRPDVGDRSADEAARSSRSLATAPRLRRGPQPPHHRRTARRAPAAADGDGSSADIVTDRRHPSRYHDRRPEPVVPGPGQESVWDYPRPPRVEPVAERLRVVVDGDRRSPTRRRACASWRRPARRSTTSRRADVRTGPTAAQPRTDASASGRAWRRTGRYDDGAGRRDRERRAGRTPSRCPATSRSRTTSRSTPAASTRRGSATSGRRPQPGGFYGGWVTSRIVGPFKGEPGIAAGSDGAGPDVSRRSARP